jgi:uncharacterized protein YabN with tetrapyrrole methylase and pyrophosphatase domain
MQIGSLVIIGTGIKAIGHITLEAKSCIEKAEKLFFLVSDPLTSQWLTALNPSAETLYSSYVEGRDRMETYLEIVERILVPVRSGLRVCAAFYGHPGVFAWPSHKAIGQARSEGYAAVMLPGISAEDCLFADLGVDPGEYGCQSYDATDFLLFRPRINPSAALVLWQIGVTGHVEHRLHYPNIGLPLMLEILSVIYPPSHLAILYEAAQYAVCEPVIQHVPIGNLLQSRMTTATTLYVSPLTKNKTDKDTLSWLSSAIAKSR